MRKKVVIIGAGGSGRGFLARLLQADGADICFIDKNNSLVEALKTSKTYNIKVGNKKPDIVISGYEAWKIEAPEAVEKTANADFIFTSIGSEHLPELKTLLGKAAKQRKKPLFIIPCENGISPKSILRNALKETAAAGALISQGVIFCTSIPKQKGKLDIVSEDYSTLPYDADEELFDLPFDHFPATHNFEMLLQRKIYTYNCLSACIAYLGDYLDYKIYSEAANDPLIEDKCLQLMDGLNKTICRSMQVDESEQMAFAKRAISKFQNRDITDTIYKNVRAAVRKLSPPERIMGPMRLMEEAGEDTNVLQLTAAAAMLYLEKNEPLIWGKKKYTDVESLFADENPQCHEDTKKQIFGMLRKLRKGELLRRKKMSLWKELDSLFDKAHIIDLSPLIEKGMPKWPTHPQVIVDPTITHEHDGYYCQSLVMGEHTGAHVDCPPHIIPSMMDHSVDTYPADMLFGPAIKYEMYKLNSKPGDRISKEQILQLEEEMGDKAGKGDIVLMEFDYQKYWKTDCEWKYYALNEPGLSEEACELFAERGVRAVGSDTIACDTPVIDGKELISYGHKKCWLPNEIFILEMLMNLNKVPTRSYFMALPLKIKNGSGSPIRPIVVVE